MKKWVWLVALLLSAPAFAQEDGTEDPENEELPEQVRALKEKVLESRARMLMLPEEIHGTIPTQAGLKLRIANELSGDFRLEKVEATLDGKPLIARTLGAGEDTRRLDHQGDLAPGAHTLDLVMTYRGHGRGLFPYMRAYEVIIEGTYPFVVPDQVVASVTATVTSENPLQKHWKQRPKLRFGLEENMLLPRMTGAPPQPPTEVPETPQ